MCAETHVISPRFSISWTAGWISIGSWTMPSTFYLFSKTRKANFLYRGGLSLMAVRTSSEGILCLRGPFFWNWG